MPRTKKIGLGGSLGSRYGIAPRKRYIQMLTRMRKKHECPRCHMAAVKRLSVGIWECRKCGYKFTGGAYEPSTKLGEVAMRISKGATGLLETESETIESSKVAQLTSTKVKRRKR